MPAVLATNVNWSPVTAAPISVPSGPQIRTANPALVGLLFGTMVRDTASSAFSVIAQ